MSEGLSTCKARNLDPPPRRAGPHAMVTGRAVAGSVGPGAYPAGVSAPTDPTDGWSRGGASRLYREKTRTAQAQSQSEEPPAPLAAEAFQTRTRALGAELDHALPLERHRYS